MEIYKKRCIIIQQYRDLKNRRVKYDRSNEAKKEKELHRGSDRKPSKSWRRQNNALKKHSDEIADIFVKLTEMAGVDAFEFLNAHFKMQPIEKEGI